VLVAMVSILQHSWCNSHLYYHFNVSLLHVIMDCSYAAVSYLPATGIEDHHTLI